MAGVRNAAAHGDFEELSRERSGLLEQQVNLFLRRLELSSNPSLALDHPDCSLPNLWLWASAGDHRGSLARREHWPELADSVDADRHVAVAVAEGPGDVLVDPSQPDGHAVRQDVGRQRAPRDPVGLVTEIVLDRGTCGVQFSLGVFGVHHRDRVGRKFGL